MGLCVGEQTSPDARQILAPLLFSGCQPSWPRHLITAPVAVETMQRRPMPRRLIHPAVLVLAQQLHHELLLVLQAHHDGKSLDRDPIRLPSGAARASQEMRDGR